MQLTKKPIAVTEDAGASLSPAIETKFPEISDPGDALIYPCVARCASAHAHEALLIERHDRAVVGATHARAAEVIGFALESDRDRAAHWILTQQTPDRCVVCRVGHRETEVA